MPDSSAQLQNDSNKPPLMDTSGPAQPSRDLVLSTSESNPASWFKRWRLAILAISVAALSVPLSFLQPSKIPIDPHDYAARTEHVLSTTPLIDGHNDLPYLIRIELHDKLYDGSLNLNDKLLGHTDIQRMRKGQMGGQFWSVYVDCEDAAGIDDPTVRFSSMNPQNKVLKITVGCSRHSRANRYYQTFHRRIPVRLSVLRQPSMRSGSLQIWSYCEYDWH